MELEVGKAVLVRCSRSNQEGRLQAFPMGKSQAGEEETQFQSSWVLGGVPATLPWYMKELSFMLASCIQYSKHFVHIVTTWLVHWEDVIFLIIQEGKQTEGGLWLARHFTVRVPGSTLSSTHICLHEDFSWPKGRTSGDQWPSSDFLRAATLQSQKLELYYSI